MSRYWLLSLAAVLALGVALPAQRTAAEDKDPPAAAKKTDDKKAEDKKDDEKKEETPDEMAARIQSNLVKSIRKDREEAIKTFEKEKAEFLAKYPTHEAQWKLKMLGVQVSMMTAGGREEAAKAALPALNEIVNAKDAPQQAREQASTMRIQLADSDKPDEVLAAVVEHIKSFPDSRMNKRIAQMAVMSIGEGDDEEKSIAKLEPLAKHDLAAIAEAAKSQIEQLKTMLELKTKPMEMKFTAVDGREVDLASLRGKVILIDFWATWCGPCVAELPNVKKAYEKLHEKGFEIVGISFDQSKESLEKFVAEKEMPWPQFFDGKGWENEYGKKYGIHGIPAMWLVGKDGKVVSFKARGKLEEKVEKLLGN